MHGEALAVKWKDLDWATGTLTIERGIVNQRIDDVTTEGSARIDEMTTTGVKAAEPAFQSIGA